MPRKPGRELSVAEQARMRLVTIARMRGPNHPDTLAAREALAYANVAAKIIRAVEDAPPLPSDVRENLKNLIDAHTASVS